VEFTPSLITLFFGSLECNSMIYTQSKSAWIAVAAIAICASTQAAPPKKTEPPRERTAYYGTDSAPAKVPGVVLSMREDALCKLKVGQPMPTIELPSPSGSGNSKLSDMLGKKATVVVFWRGNNRMTTEELSDLGPDVLDRYGKNGVEVVGIAVETKLAEAKEALDKIGAKFPNLLDEDGNAFALVGKDALPRTFVLDSAGKIVWFDISYTLATRRELRETLRSLAGDGKQK
jgi:peroxiredoxin